jgi:hypothetical protein
MENKVTVLSVSKYKTHYRTFVKFDIKINEITHELNMTFSDFTYDNIINTLINIVYPQDKMQAIINNYLLDKEENHVVEFNEMQNYRKHCKDIAKDVLNKI